MRFLNKMTENKKLVQLFEYIKRNKILIIFGIILAASIFFRFYFFKEKLHFMGDEGYHLQQVKDILKGNFPGKGPGASADSDLYHGAFYYYIMFIPGLIGGFSPASLAFFTALSSVAAIFLVFFPIRRVYGEKVALFTTAVYAVSNIIIMYNRWAWNPNLIPFFMALAIFSLVKILDNKRTDVFCPLFAFSLSAITQLHLIGLVFVPILLIFLPIIFKYEKRCWVWAIAFAAFMLPWVPTLAYESRHGYTFFIELGRFYFHSSNNIPISKKIAMGLLYFRNLQFEIYRVDGFIFMLFSFVYLSYFTLFEKDKVKKFTSFFIMLVFLLSIIEFGGSKEVLTWHLGEYLFIIICLFFGIFAGAVSKNNIGLIFSLFIFYFICRENIHLFNITLVQKTSSYEVDKAICQEIKKTGDTTADVFIIRDNPFSNEENPLYISEVCQKEDKIVLGSGPKYNIYVDFNSGSVELRNQ